MHDSSMDNMQKCFDRFLKPHLSKITDKVTVVDCGAMNVNGSYRSIFDHDCFDFKGIDMAPGEGVDIVTENPYKYPLPDRCADIVLSGQMLEHSEFFWVTFLEMLRLLKPGGYLFLIVPSKGDIHRFPVDCYRFLPDSMQALARYAQVTLVDHWVDEISEWGDLVGIFMKPATVNPIEPEERYEAPIFHHQGRVYDHYISDYVTTIKSKAHLEIGTYTGRSIAPLTCPSIVIDPTFNVQTNIIGSKEMLLMFQMTSDAFFDHYDPAYLLKSKLDTAFLDGMHLFEYLLRDFINTEKACHSRATIFMHDCLPTTVGMTSRNQADVDLSGPVAHWWTGDVWKVIPILRKYRPDLKITCFNCPPTGLVQVENLDPDNSTLSDHYDEIMKDFMAVNLTKDMLTDYLLSCDIQPA